MFENSYDNHPLASESNMTPAQLWLYGMAKYQGEWELPEEDMLSFGIDYDGPLPSNELMGTLGMIFQFKYLKFHVH